MQLSIIAFAIIFGYCSGCYVSLIPTCVNQLGDSRTAGSRMGALFSLMSFAGLFGTPIAGFIMGEAPYRWWACVAFSGGCVTVGLAFILLARHFAARDLPFRP
jgi:MCP family monocarboxylic acid transporter-like MFS transporter 10